MSHADPNCIFCKIVAGQIPAQKVFEDDEVLVFKDIQPWAPVHQLLIPKRHIASKVEVTPADQALMGKLTVLAPRLMAEAGVSNGFRQVINTGADGGQEVFHLFELTVKAR